MFAVEPIALFIAGAFVLAGLVKGVVGLGLPIVAIGLLAIVIPPAEAAAILIVPSLATNVWQMMAGPYLRSLVRRLWPTMMGVAIGALAGTGWLTDAEPRLARALLGLALVNYAASGLWSLRPTVTAAAERWVGPIIGTATGLVTAATGVFAIPAAPYLQAIGLEKDELVQALGLSFTVSTAALAVNLALSSALSLSIGSAVVIALVAAFAGMGLGQAVRARLRPATFRVAFLVGLLMLGVFLVVRAIA
jgi:uncharacterized membrane protein YfcA